MAGRTVINATGMFKKNDMTAYHKLLRKVSIETVLRERRKGTFQKDANKVDLLVDYKPGKGLMSMERIAIFTDTDMINWDAVLNWMFHYITTHGPHSPKQKLYPNMPPWRLLHYTNAHVLLLNGSRVTQANIPTVAPKTSDVVTLINMVPYATRIEGSKGGKSGWSKQTPSGVYKRMLRPLRVQFGGRFQFTYKQIATVPGEAARILRGVKKSSYYRYPSITVVLRKGAAVRFT